MRSFVAGALLGAASATVIPNIEHAFMKFIAEHGKSYGTLEEYKFRMQQFERIDKVIVEHRSSSQTFEVGHNHMSDWSEAEYNKLMGYRPRVGVRPKKIRKFTPSNADGINWVTKGAVTPVQNQKQCGSCWAFSTVGSMEGANQIETGKLVKLSEQQLVDCAKNGNHGCLGGLMDLGFTYAETTPLETEAEYPYKGFAIGGCKYKKGDGVVGVGGFFDVTPNSPDQFKAALDKQPVSVAIQANTAVFQTYKKGVITSEKCGTKLDHGVLAVGYGTEDGNEYFLVKNSWGPTWGEEGYVKIGVAAGAGICGINSEPSAPCTNVPSKTA